MSSTASKADCGRPAYGDARRTRASASSTSHCSIATIETSCWARTSSGLRGTLIASIAPCFMRSVTTAVCTRSPRYLGNITPRDTAPTWWPARPMRWSPLATLGGDSTCTTRSTAPMSIPSSRLLVATTAGSWPDFSSSSVMVRCSRLTEPWCARANSVSRPRSKPISLRRLVSRSASRRALVKTMVERCAAMRSKIRSSTCGQIDFFGCPSSTSSGAPMSSTGTTTLMSNVFAAGGWTTVERLAPPRNRATSSTGRTVADSPIRCAGLSSSASSRSRESARCAPRLVPATACTSSTITVSTPRSDSRACDVKIKNNDSGVVIKMSGGLVVSRRRSSAGVSPERTATSMLGTGTPSRVAACRMPTSGERKLRSTSTASAFNGEMYNTRHRAVLSDGAGVEAMRSSAHKKAASVLPEPVGATTSVCSPPEIACHACCCASVGRANAEPNQSRVMAEKPASGSGGPAARSARAARAARAARPRARRPTAASASCVDCGPLRRHSARRPRSTLRGATKSLARQGFPA